MAYESLSVLTLRSPVDRELGRLASHDLRSFFPELTKGRDFFLSNEFARRSLYAIDAEDDVLRAASDAARVYRYPGGLSRPIVTLALTPVPVPETVRAELQRTKDAVKPPFHLYVPSRLPLLRHLAVGPDDDLWVFVESLDRTGFMRFS